MDIALFLIGWMLIATALGLGIAAFISAGKLIDRGLVGHSVHNGRYTND